MKLATRDSMSILGVVVAAVCAFSISYRCAVVEAGNVRQLAGGLPEEATTIGPSGTSSTTTAPNVLAHRTVIAGNATPMIAAPSPLVVISVTPNQMNLKQLIQSSANAARNLTGGGTRQGVQQYVRSFNNANQDRTTMVFEQEQQRRGDGN